MDTPHTLRPHLELGDICRIVSDGGIDLLGLEQLFGLVVGGVEGQVVDLLAGDRKIKINRRFLEPFAREVISDTA